MKNKVLQRITFILIILLLCAFYYDMTRVLQGHITYGLIWGFWNMSLIAINIHTFCLLDNPEWSMRFYQYTQVWKAKIQFRRDIRKAKRAASAKGLTFMIDIGSYGGFEISYEKKFAMRFCLGWIAFSIYFVDMENYISNVIEKEKYAKKLVDMVIADGGESVRKRDEGLKKTLAKFQEDPNYELMQEFGKLLMKDVDSLTPKEKKRYDELRNLLNPKKVN